MKYILARAGSKVLMQLASSRLLVGLDFDGTLAPIVARRGDARMRGRTKRLLDLVCRVYPCAVISGRSRQDVESRLGTAPVKYVVGNHGAESASFPFAFTEEARATREALTRVLSGRPGVEVEDKRHSVSVHYHHANDRTTTLAAVDDAVAQLPFPMRIVPGKLVLNVVSARAPNKGQALLSLMSEERVEAALFVGDDSTDEDAFAADQRGRVTGVRVGRSGSSAARYFLQNQVEIDALLAALLRLRTTRS